MPARVEWYAMRARQVTTIIPLKAHGLAAVSAAKVAARTVGSTYSGGLARDLSKPKPIAPGRTLLGSNLPQTSMEEWGGEIRPKRFPYLYLRDRRKGASGQATRSTFRGNVMATVGPGRGKSSVRHHGKHMIAKGAAEYRAAFPRILRELYHAAGFRI